MDDGSYKLTHMVFKTVIIFGTFDYVHEGHLHFIRQAKKQGERLVAIVARDEVALKIKTKKPINDELERFNKVLNIEDIDLVFLGDREQGVYNTLKEINPDMIFLGYDQGDLHNDILEKIKSGYLPKMELIFGEPYLPEIFHSSILNKNK
jgi:cytidyltransferase-like protein